MLVVVVLGYTVSALGTAASASAASADVDDYIETVEALATAKAALLAWAVVHPDTPGSLPFPERETNLQSRLDVDCQVRHAHLLGRFPDDGGTHPCSSDAAIGLNVHLTDAADEQLWYAVSANLVDGGIVGPVNIGLRGTPPHPWLNVCDEHGDLISDRVAAVIIAPGSVQDGQDRDASDDPQDYLESFTVDGKTFDNHDIDGQPDASGCGVAGEDFILVTGTGHTGFNDRLTYITVDELMNLAQQRVIGEVANLLESQRETYGSYPWLSPFQPRVVRAEGTASAGSSATVLNDTNANFVGDGVAANDTVRNLTDGSQAVVVARTATTITVGALSGGTDNRFDEGDRYELQPAFAAAVGTREGQLPFHVAGQAFSSAFTVSWTLSNAPVTKSTAIPVDFDIYDFHLSNLASSVASSTGSGPRQVVASANNCTWQDETTVRCTGSAPVPIPAFPLDLYVASRTYEFDFDLKVSAAHLTVGSNSVGYKVRSASYQPQSDPSPTQLRITVVDRDDLGAVIGTARIDPTAASYGSVNIANIHYFPVPGDDLPTWLVDNNWHHYVYAAAAAGQMDGGSGCTVGANCLTLDHEAGTMVRDDVQALVVGAGPSLLGQDRDVAPACGTPSQGRCHYFENENIDAADDRFETRDATASFNDQVRVVAPKHLG